jgi:hypothetical protein
VHSICGYERFREEVDPATIAGNTKQTFSGQRLLLIEGTSVFVYHSASDVDGQFQYSI